VQTSSEKSLIFEKRLLQFSKDVLKLCKSISQTSINNPLGRIKFKDIRKISIGISKKDILSYKLTFAQSNKIGGLRAKKLLKYLIIPDNKKLDISEDALYWFLIRSDDLFKIEPLINKNFNCLVEQFLKILY
jgi:hypothetical protein